MHWHSEAADAPCVEVLLFAWQLVAEVDELGQKKPYGHRTEVETPGAQNEPRGQVTATPLTQKVPAAHVAGADAIGRQTEPLGQAVAFAAPAGQKNCDGHGVEIPFWQK